MPVLALEVLTVTGNWTTEELLRWDQEHIIHPVYPVGQEVPGIVFEKGRGVMLYDTEGREYIDCSSQLTCANLGYGRADIIDAAVEQMKKLEYTTLHMGFSHKAAIEYSRKLAGVTPEGLNHFIFVDGGAEGNETAFTMARLGQKSHKIISLYDSYHGVGIASATATGVGKGQFWRGVELAPGFIHIPSYYCYRCAFGKEHPGCGIQCAKFLAETIEKEGPESVAAFIAEPMLGVGGTVKPPPEYWPMVREICNKYDVLLVADEVMTGFGRTGRMWCLEHWGVTPDILVMSKGIAGSFFPFAAVAISDRVFDSLKGQTVRGFTYGGHPVGCAIASRVLDIYAEERVVENAAGVGKYIMERLNAEFESLPCVDNIDGLGLFIAMEIVRDKATRATFEPKLNMPVQILKQAREKGLLLRSGSIVSGPGDRVRITPPLLITAQEADRALDILYPILASIKPD